MDEYIDAHCDECDETLVQLSGEWLCPQCDSLSGFTLVPQESEFTL